MIPEVAALMVFANVTLAAYAVGAWMIRSRPPTVEPSRFHLIPVDDPEVPEFWDASIEPGHSASE